MGANGPVRLASPFVTCTAPWLWPLHLRWGQARPPPRRFWNEAVRNAALVFSFGCLSRGAALGCALHPNRARASRWGRSSGSGCITCRDEKHQCELLERFLAERLTC